jgi:hypothetical protein
VGTVLIYAELWTDRQGHGRAEVTNTVGASRDYATPVKVARDTEKPEISSHFQVLSMTMIDASGKTVNPLAQAQSQVRFNSLQDEAQTALFKDPIRTAL